MDGPDRRRTRPIILVAAAVVAGVSIGTTALLQSVPSGRAPASPPDVGAAATAGSAGPVPSDGTALPPVASSLPPARAIPSAAAPGVPDDAAEAAWKPAQLPPYAPPARLVPASFDASGVAIDSAFQLISSGDVPAAALAAGLTATPSLRLSATPRGDGSVTIRPATTLTPGTVYRFVARAPDGSLGGEWTFRAAAPLRVASTIPGDRQTMVPLDTGIEVAFDQDGVTGAADHIRIVPATAGRFEQHGRTAVFVPTRPLAPRTLYRVTVTHGVRIAGSSQLLEEDVSFAFETESTPSAGETPYRFARRVLEVPVGAAPVLAQSGPTAGATVAVDVYRYASLEAATAAARRMLGSPDWTYWSAGGRLPTSGLSHVLAASLRAVRIAGDHTDVVALTLPRSLPAGLYLVEERAPGGLRPQLILQVTDVASYALASTADSLVWVNDIATGRPLAGASVEIVGGGPLGATDADGLLRVRLPDAAQAAVASGESSRAPLLVVRAADGRAAFVPLLDTAGWNPYWGVGYGLDPEADGWWRLFTTDRTTFRSTDVVNAWGYIRSRTDREVPREVELRLDATSWDGPEDGQDRPPIRTVAVRPAASGAFAASLAIEDLPLGSYELEMRVADRTVERMGIQVGVIRKPSYRLEIETDRSVYVEGDRATIGVLATFFDGTPVPGVDVRIEAWSDVTTLRTGPDGRATTTRTVSVEACCREGIRSGSISATVVGTEEGWTGATSDPLVLSSRRWLTADAKATSKGATVAGILTTVDLARLERDHASIDPQTDPSGRPVAGEVRYAVLAQVPIVKRYEVGYDFVEKRTVRTPVWETTEKVVRSGTVRSDRSGRFSVAVPLPSATGYPVPTYRVVLSTSDAGGHAVPLTVTLPEPRQPSWGSMTAYLAQDPVCIDRPWPCGYRVGDEVRRTMTDGDGAFPSGGPDRYLWATLQRGLRDVSVGTSSTYRARFAAADAPNLALTGVRFTGAAYITARASDLVFDPSERRLQVRLTTDLARYAPGGTVRLGIRTLDGAGRPVPASVAVRVIDEKLYVAGLAYEEDPLALLYRPVSSGLLRTYASHPLPLGGWGGGGDTTGGGGRRDFEDVLAARLVTTGADGRGELAFTLSDDLTAWHVSATALTGDLQAGVASTLVPVGLPFFVEAPVAPEYLVGERPVLRLRAYGDALTPGRAVTFTVSSTTMPLPVTTVRGVAFEPVTVALPPLAEGRQTIRVTASGVRSADGTVPSDALYRSFDVVPSRLTRTTTTYETLTQGAHPEGGELTSYVFSDLGRGRYLCELQTLARSTGARIDARLAALAAREELVRTFAVPEVDLPPMTFDPTRYQRQQFLALLPYGSDDLAVSARVALLAAEHVDGTSLAAGFEYALEDPERTSEQRSYALAGLGGLGVDVGARIRQTLAEGSPTIRERLLLALAAATLGDTETALRVERDLLGASGEQLGEMVRLRVGASLDDTIEATALVALIAATIGDPVAVPTLAYVDDQPSAEQSTSLERAVTISRLIDRLPAAAAGFAYRVGGVRRVVELAAGDSWTLRLTPAQRATLSFEPLSGTVGVATTWSEPMPAARMTVDPALGLARRTVPSGLIAADSVVEVTLTARFGPAALTGLYEVAELAPSGLAPLPLTEMWRSADAGSDAVREDLLPYAIDGQLVSFALARPTRGDSVTLRYLARVVTPGTYRWEPAVMQAVAAAEAAAVTPEGTAVIR